ncbi:ribosomal subunit 39S-domain-containing protein [Annulohypoxylon moriforme]|nr:ribosomal subunit 39S-domain-containing protein [Annulohypoxylon moriforme]
MRRITRLRRPSGLSAKITHSSIAPLVGQSPSAPSHTLSTSSPRRPIPATAVAGLQSPALTRLYSTEKQQPPNSQDPNPNTEIEQPKSPIEEVPKAEEPNVEVPTAEPQVLAPPTPEEPQWTTFKPPPRRRVYTERADKVSDTSYKPAVTDAGLEVVGGTERWWETRKHWPKSADFVGFRPRERARDPAILEAAVRRAVVEAFVLRQAGREDALVTKWPVGGVEELRRVLGVQVAVAADGGVALEGGVQAVLEALEGEVGDDIAKRPALKVAEIEEFRGAWGKEWKGVSLAEPRIRFAVTKRIFQLTGHLVQDFQLSGVNSVQTLLHVVQKPPKPKTLTQEIQEKRQDLVQMPNVSIATKRITRGDQAKAVGRYKLIEEEYKKRELPLLGHGGAPKNTEVVRLMGDV